MLITVTTQLPECHEFAVSWSNGKSAGILYQLACLVAFRTFCEVLFGFFWGILSWFLQWGSISLLKRSRVRPVLAAAILVAGLEGLILGWPLAWAYAGTVNFNMDDDPRPPVTISDRSIMIEFVGIIIAFVLPSLVAGCMATPKSRELC